MKKLTSLFLMAVLGGLFSLTIYKFFLEEDKKVVYQLASTAQPQYQSTIPIQKTVNYTNAASEGIDFSHAAEQTVNGVVHVKNKRVGRQPRNLMEMIRGDVSPQEFTAGAGSGVIITPDGFIVTNNHVIEGASKLEVTLNDNRTYEAEVIGTDPNADIALIKVDTDQQLPYIPFGDSDAIKVGEWALAVGNPFNLTSTVTAGIISAKARDLNDRDGQFQSFIQTDAAINPGNSGGALVNTSGQLIGINTAITSFTGSYVGYAFAVPSNNARKIVEDLMEFGSVQKGVLGVRGDVIPSERIDDSLLNGETEGFFITNLEYGGGAEKSGIKEGDIIKSVDDIKISKFSDLTGYLNSKSPNDVVQVKVKRDGRERVIPVTLVKSQTIQIQKLGIEVKNASPDELKANNAENGVVISNLLTAQLAKRYGGLLGRVITEIDDQKIYSTEDVQKILSKKDSSDPISFVFLDQDGERNRFTFD